MSLREEALELHRRLRGKFEITSKLKLKSAKDLSLVYTPGVAEPCLEIAAHPDMVNEYTARGNMVAVVTDGSAVLGLGNIGAQAALPVMEGKAILFKEFGGVDAFPVCINSQEVNDIVEVVSLLEPSFGGINLEDISAPRCFDIEAMLKDRMGIPIFHDDQHGTAVVTLAAVINALRLSGRDFSDLSVVINGAGAAGIAIAKLLLRMGTKNIVICDRTGAIFSGRSVEMNAAKNEIAMLTNPDGVDGALADAVIGRDIFIGVSAPRALTADMVRLMAPRPIIFAMANPDPEIDPHEAKAAGAAIVGTGRSDFPNQINNVLGFPGIFRGALDVEATDINEDMKISAAQALAGILDDEELNAEKILPEALDLRVAPAVAKAVAAAAMNSGVARRDVDPEQVAAHCRALIGTGEDD